MGNQNFSEENNTEILLRMNKDGVFEKYEEPFAVIECQTEEDFNRIKIAIEKQNPKKFEIWNGQCSCPNCKYLFGNYKTFKTLIHWEMPYCKNCGQALDWEEEDEE